MAYVIKSRATHDAKVYTDNMKNLEKYFSQDVSKTSALKGVNELAEAPTINPTPAPSNPMNTHSHDKTLQPGQPTTRASNCPLDPQTGASSYSDADRGARRQCLPEQRYQRAVARQQPPSTSNSRPRVPLTDPEFSYLPPHTGRQQRALSTDGP